MLKKLAIVLCVIGGGITAFTACHSTMLGLDRVDQNFANKPAASPSLADHTLDTWQADRTQIQTTFQTLVYGPWPDPLAVQQPTKRVVNNAFHGGTLEEWTLVFAQGSGQRIVHMAVAIPPKNTPTTAFIVALSFGSNCAAFVGATLTSPTGTLCEGDPMSGFFGGMVKRIFGAYIAHVPIAQYFDSGIGYANVFASEFIPDSPQHAPQVMQALNPQGVQPTSALMGWAYLQAEMARLLAEDARLSAAKFVSAGHSRFGKVSLISAAWSDHIDMAVSIQSGFGGAALSRSDTGETIARMLDGPQLMGGLIKMQGFPHWLTPNAREWADDPSSLAVDQHMLLALIAPKPVLLTNGRKDVWSDPNSTFRAALGANPIYKLYGKGGLEATALTQFRPQDAIAYTLTKDGHGVRQDDISAIIAFIQAHTAASPVIQK